MSKYKYDILKLLYASNNEYISGQAIADQLKISRTAVWKSIESLKQEGYIFSSIQNKGYQISGYPSVWNEDMINLLLEENQLLKEAFVYHEVDSTQLTAQELAMNKDYNFLVISEVQNKGRGRFKRQWDSKEGNGLWMSIVLHPDIPYRHVATFNLFISLAISEAISKVTDLDARIKWPNDIYINDRKTCGFLTEINGDSDGVKQITCGIGININHKTSDFPDELNKTATSLAIEKGETVDRYKLFSHLMIEIEKYYTLFLKEPFKAVKEEYKEKSFIWKKELRYTEGNKVIYGRAIDIQDDGLLVVLDDEGAMHHFISADIEMQV